MKTTLKTIIYCMFLIGISQSILAQNATEIGFTASGLDNFDLLYKKQKSENKWFRLRGSSLNIGYQEVEGGSSAFNFNFGFGIGSEYRIPIGEKISFIHGPEFFTSFSYQKSGDRWAMGITPGIGYLLGFRYDISDKFSFSMETRPSLRAGMFFGDNSGLDRFNVAAGFNSNAISLGLAYKFKKK
jgi:hypothetical protein